MSKSEFKLCRLIYYSSASPHLQDSDVDAILDEAIRRNGRCGITGLLAYDAFYFMQILEGEDEAVNTLYLSIAADPRHYDVRLILYQRIEERRFSEWSMALAKLPDVPGRYIDNLYGDSSPSFSRLTMPSNTSTCSGTISSGQPDTAQLLLLRPFLGRLFLRLFVFPLVLTVFPPVLISAGRILTMIDALGASCCLVLAPVLNVVLPRACWGR